MLCFNKWQFNTIPLGHSKFWLERGLERGTEYRFCSLYRKGGGEWYANDKMTQFLWDIQNFILQKEGEMKNIG